MIYLEEQAIVTFYNISMTNHYSSKNGGMIYSTEATGPASSSITFLTAATISNCTSLGNGGCFYIDNSVMNIYMNTPITLTSATVSTGYGGVFYIKRA